MPDKITFVYESYLDFSFLSCPVKNKPVCWNWQTRRTQNPLSARTCGFDPHHRHQKTGASYEVRGARFFCNTSDLNRCSKAQRRPASGISSCTGYNRHQSNSMFSGYSPNLHMEFLFVLSINNTRKGALSNSQYRTNLERCGQSGRTCDSQLIR